VSFDTAEENKAFAEKFDFNFPLLCDTSREVGRAYGACDDASASSARRIGVVIDPEGKVKEYLAKVDAAKYPSEVLSRI
jgi:thioredoxin-dependent peroxiredoxin